MNLSFVAWREQRPTNARNNLPLVRVNPSPRLVREKNREGSSWRVLSEELHDLGENSLVLLENEDLLGLLHQVAKDTFEPSDSYQRIVNEVMLISLPTTGLPEDQLMILLGTQKAQTWCELTHCVPTG